MNLEDELRATMRAHEDEAPRGLSLPVRRRRVWLPALAAAAVVLAVVGVSVALGRHGDPDPVTRPSSPLSCPARVGQGTGVPAARDDIAPRDRLVPDSVPRSVVVCSYVRRGYGGPVVTGHRVLGGDLAAVSDTLAFVPQRVDAPCTDDLRVTDDDNHLIGLTYAAGTVWVAAPDDHCAGSTNGRYDSHVNLSGFARRAAAAGHWVGARYAGATGGACEPVGAGRLGEDTLLVPDTPTGLVICSSERGSGPVRVRTGFTALVDDLRRIPVGPTDNECRGETPATDYTLLFTYADGPDTLVAVDGSCRPDLTNYSVHGDDTRGVVHAEIRRLLAAD